MSSWLIYLIIGSCSSATTIIVERVCDFIAKKCKENDIEQAY